MDAVTLAAISVPDAVAVAAVVAPSCVAIAAIIVGYKQQSRGIEHERKLADLSTVREVIDASAVHLHRVSTVLDNLRFAVLLWGPDFLKDDSGEARFLALHEARDEFDILRARLAVLLGRDHETVASFTEANEAVQEIYIQLLGLRQQQALMSEPDDPGAEQDSVERFRRNFEVRFRDFEARLPGQYDFVEDKRGEFMDAAQRTAGAQLPASRLPDRATL